MRAAGVAKTGRGNKAIETLPHEVRRRVDAGLDLGGEPKALYEELGLAKDDIALRTFQAYATQRRREHKLRIVRDEIALFQSIVELAGLDRRGLSELQQIQLGTALQAMTGSRKATVRLNAVKVIGDIREDQRRQESHTMAREKFDAWRAEHERAERERKAAADRRVEEYGKDEGLSDAAIARIKEIYGLAGGGADGRDAA